MGPAPGSPTLSGELSTRFVERALQASDRIRASLWWGLGTTVVVAALWLLQAPKADVGLQVLLAVWWVSWAFGAVAFRLRGASRLTQAAEVLAELAAAWAAVVAVSVAHTLITPVWWVSFARAFAWGPRRRSATRAIRWGAITAHLALAVSLALTGQFFSGAVIVLALLVSQIVVLEVSSQLVRQRLALEAESEALHHQLEELEVQRENDRIARELHDGLGAELVALMLALRSKGAEVAPHTQRVLHMLEELRSAIWSLRGGRGTLSEFEKLVRARARVTLAGTDVSSSSDARHLAKVVEPEVAMSMLTAVQDVLLRAADLTLPRLLISIEAELALAVTLRFPEVSPISLAGLAVPPAADGRVVSAIDDGAALRIVVG